MKVLKCGARESWRSVRLIILEVKYYKESRRKEYPTYNKNKDSLLKWSQLA